MNLPPQVSGDVGVVVGRFQVPALTPAHRNLIGHVLDHHRKVLVLLGLSPLWASARNPLDFEARKQMILAEFPNLTVLPIRDVGDDARWSGDLDAQIATMVAPGQTAVLYGGRDSFLTVYDGDWPSVELDADGGHAGTVIRRDVATGPAVASEEFRAGVIWAARARYPAAITTVDVAIFNDDHTRMLMCRKPTEALWRFVGGFSEPGSPNFEADARREVMEETGIAITDPIYLASFHIDDWRYRGEADQIKTLLFAATLLSGHPEPRDDLRGGAVSWINVADLTGAEVMPLHRPLLNTARTYAEHKNGQEVQSHA